jgi:hypothetical protein
VTRLSRTSQLDRQVHQLPGHTRNTCVHVAFVACISGHVMGNMCSNKCHVSITIAKLHVVARLYLPDGLIAEPMCTENTPVRSAHSFPLTLQANCLDSWPKSAGFEPTGRKKQGWLGRVTFDSRQLMADAHAIYAVCYLTSTSQASEGRCLNHDELLL